MFGKRMACNQKAHGAPSAKKREINACNSIVNVESGYTLNDKSELFFCETINLVPSSDFNLKILLLIRLEATYALLAPPELHKIVLEPSSTSKNMVTKLGFGTGVWTFWCAAGPDCKEESNPHEHRPKCQTPTLFHNISRWSLTIRTPSGFHRSKSCQYMSPLSIFLQRVNP